MAAANANPQIEKVQNLPSLCVESILKFTPTSKLIRLYSNAAPLPGAFWSSGLETMLRKRLPLSLGANPPYHHAAVVPTVVFDAAGAKVACVKHPAAFRFCPLLEFIESAFLPVHAVVEQSTRGAIWQFYVRDGDAVLLNLPNVTALSFVPGGGKPPFEQKDLLASNLKHLLPQLESLVVKRSPGIWSEWEDRTVCDFLRAMPMREMLRLRRLDLPVAGFRSAMQQSSSGDFSMQSVLSGLSSLGIWRSDAVRADVLRFVSTGCRELTALFVFVSGEFKTYLDAFRALTSLTTLGMELDLWSMLMNGLTYDGSEVINSVSDLRIISASQSYSTGVSIFKIATFFPNVRANALKDGPSTDLFELAASVFGERQLFPAIAKLGCFSADEIFWHKERLTLFLANPHLPEAVDLSHVDFQDLACDADLLTAIYCAMQASSIKSLLLRGPVHREALPRLQGHIALNGENAKVSAWKDRDVDDLYILWLAPFSQQTDLQIIGLKTSGNLKGERFTIRVFHHLAKQVDFFD